MKIISHRGNVNGRVPQEENNPSYVESAIRMGYDVEVDVSSIDGTFYLGHDEPQYEVTSYWLNASPIWCHAKNKDALSHLISIGAHCFWHETDRFTFTSRGFVWAYPDNFISGGVTVVLSSPQDANIPSDLYGICTDYSLPWSEITDRNIR
jgi:hypothetical protein